MAGTKFYGSTSTFLLSVAAFISLSGGRLLCTGCCLGGYHRGVNFCRQAVLSYISADDGRQCYWCGPLAEQVHRSRRAPPCDAPKAHVTSCDPGFLHCAVVATSPPYIESRYCVKIYQDECYLDYCNSTKTWKMTCPCKGDLCNGQNSDREDEAFAELVEKTQKPFKKRTKKSVEVPLMKSVNTEDNNSIINYNLSAIEIKRNESYKNEVYEKDFVTHIEILNFEESEPLIQSETEEPVTSDNLLVNSVNDQTEIDKITIQVNDETTKNINDAEFKETASIETTPLTLDSTVKITEINKIEKPLIANLLKPSEELPTAEALQESANPNAVSENEKVQTTLTEELTVTPTEAELTTENSINRKNVAIKLKCALNLLMFAIFNLCFLALF